MAKAKKKRVTVEEFNLRNFIVGLCRGAYKKTPMYADARNAAKQEYFVKSKKGSDMRRVHYKCAKCGRYFRDVKGARKIAVDHLDAVVNTKTGWTGYDTFIDRLFNGRVQVLCNYKGLEDGVKSCHALKTLEERKELRETKKRLKAEGKSK